MEVPINMNALIDAAKICDLALLVVDASFGFEMEIFEFLNAAQVIDFFVMILLDEGWLFENPSSLQISKKDRRK